MFKHIFIFCLFLAPLFIHAKNIELSGKVYNFDHTSEEKKRLYYTFDKNPFDSTKFIEISSDKSFHWEMQINKIKKKEIESLTFSVNLDVDLENRYACVHTLRLDKIIAHHETSNSDITINCDLLLDFNCITSVYYGAKMEGLERFTGNYVMTVENRTINIELQDFSFQYISSFSGKEISLFPEEEGGWKYNDSEKTMTFNVYLLRNEALGLMKKTRYSYSFKVEETNGNIKFLSDEYQLKKL